MKKTLLTLSLGLSTLVGFSQTATVLFEEDFSSSVSSEILTPDSEIAQNAANGFDGNAGFGEHLIYNDVEYTLLLWENNLTYILDSVVTEVKIAKTFGANDFTEFDGDELGIEGYTFFEILYDDEEWELEIEEETYFIFSSVEEFDDYFLAKNVEYDEFNSNLEIYELDRTLDYYLGDYYGESLEEAIEEFCLFEYPDDLDCFNDISSQTNGADVENTLKIDDIKVTAYSNITSLEDLISKEKEVVSACNILGQKVSPDTKNEVLIVKYSDGSTKRVFFQD